MIYFKRLLIAGSLLASLAFGVNAMQQEDNNILRFEAALDDDNLKEALTIVREHPHSFDSLKLDRSRCEMIALKLAPRNCFGVPFIYILQIITKLPIFPDVFIRHYEELTIAQIFRLAPRSQQKILFNYMAAKFNCTPSQAVSPIEAKVQELLNHDYDTDYQQYENDFIQDLTLYYSFNLLFLFTYFSVEPDNRGAEADACITQALEVLMNYYKSQPDPALKKLLDNYANHLNQLTIGTQEFKNMTPDNKTPAMLHAQLQKCLQDPNIQRLIMLLEFYQAIGDNQMAKKMATIIKRFANCTQAKIAEITKELNFKELQTDDLIRLFNIVIK